MGPVNVIQRAIEKLEAAENGQKKKICSIVSTTVLLPCRHWLQCIIQFITFLIQNRKKTRSKVSLVMLSHHMYRTVFFGKEIAEKVANEKITSQGYCVWLGMVWLRLIPKICIVFFKFA